jgi:hypothetical protein
MSGDDTENSQKQVDDLVKAHLTSAPQYTAPSLKRESVCETFVELDFVDESGKKYDRAGRGIDDLTQFMDDLETRMDSKMGIQRHKIEMAVDHINGEKCSLIIRDARGQEDNNKKPHELPESYRILAAGRIRGAMYLIKQCSMGYKADVYKSCRSLFLKYDKLIEESSTEKERLALIAKLDKDLVKTLKSYHLELDGVKLAEKDNAKKLLENAVDIATLTEKEHPAIVSISADVGSGAHKVTSTIPVRPFENKDRDVSSDAWYESLRSSKNPLNKARYKLLSPVCDALNDGKHMKPTQLSEFSAGIANFQYQSSHFVDSSGTEIGSEKTRYGVYRSGTCAFAKGKHEEKALVANYTKENVAYKNKFVGDGEFASLTHEKKINAALKEEGIISEPISGARRTPGMGSDFNNIKKPRARTIFRMGSYSIGKNQKKGRECKSGKDRTGIVVMEDDMAITESFAKERGLDKTVAENIALNTHDIFIAAGGRGGTRGAFGINGKGVTRFLGKEARMTRRIGYIEDSNALSKLNHVQSPSLWDKAVKLGKMLKGSKPTKPKKPSRVGKGVGNPAFEANGKRG